MDLFFLPAADGSGQRLCVHHAPATGVTRGAILYVHPWAEEMNKSRRMAALQSRALAAAGFAVLQLDLHGCGDSSGDFGDASWEGWVDDVLLGAHWLRERHPDMSLTLWGLRAGALLCTQAAARLDERCSFLFWQPSLTGKLVLQQFLRLKGAAAMQQGDGKGVMGQAQRDLAAGLTLDIAGYAMAPALAQGLGVATLDLPPTPGVVHWLEVSPRADAALMPASADRIDAWHKSGRTVHAKVVRGPMFWQTQEIEDAPELLSATLDSLLPSVRDVREAATS